MSLRRNIKTLLIVVILMLFGSRALIYGDEITENVNNLQAEENIDQAENETEEDKKKVQEELNLNEPAIIVEESQEETPAEEEPVTETVEEEIPSEDPAEEETVFENEDSKEETVQSEEETVPAVEENTEDSESSDEESVQTVEDYPAIEDIIENHTDNVGDGEGSSPSGNNEIPDNLTTFNGTEECTIDNQTVTVDERNINIIDARLGQMVTNTDYSYLSFKFSSDADSTVYECYIAGFNVRYDGTDITLVNGIKLLISDIANTYYNNKQLYISDIKAGSRSQSSYDKYGIVIDPIDAEKTHIKDDNNKYPIAYPYGDSDLCWAASASDMLELTGWNDGLYTDEDTTFDYFEESYTDDGSLQDVGNKWFMNGVNANQEVNHKDGTVIYDSATATSSQLRTSNTGAKVKDYAEELIGSENYLEVIDPDYEKFYEDVLSIRNGNAIGFGTYFYSDEKGIFVGGHAITEAGYIINTSKNGIDALAALFISDSDNDKKSTYIEYPEYGDRSKLPNSITMLEVDKTYKYYGSNPSGDAIRLLNYVKEGYEAPILTYATLKAKANVTDVTSADYVEKDTGTKDVYNNIDLIVDYIAAEDNGNLAQDVITEGEGLYLASEIVNSSYVSLPIAGLYTEYIYNIELDGEPYETLDLYAKVLYGYSDTQFGALDTTMVVYPYVFTKPGTYTLSGEIGKVFYLDENKNETLIPEAYVSNNFTSYVYKLIVKAKEIIYNNDDDDKDDAVIVVQEPVKKKNTAKTYPSYKAVVQSDKENGNEVKLSNIKTKISSIYMKGIGDIKNKYTITYNKDGSAIIKLSDELIKSLVPGKYTFNLYDANQNIIATVEVEVNAQLGNDVTDTEDTTVSETTEKTDKAVTENNTTVKESNVSLITKTVNKIRDFFKGIFSVFSR